MKKYVKVSVYKAVLNSYETVYGFECPLLGLVPKLWPARGCDEAVTV